MKPTEEKIQTLVSDNTVNKQTLQTLVSDNTVNKQTLQTLVSDNTVNKQTLQTLVSDNTVNKQTLQTLVSDTKQNICIIRTTNKQQITSTIKYTAFNEYIALGEYSFDATNQSIKIPKGTSIVELGGAIAGAYSVNIVIQLFKKATDSIYFRNNIVVPGNDYSFWRHALPSEPIILEPTQEYYANVLMSPYNTSLFYLNDGFSINQTFIYAKKIK